MWSTEDQDMTDLKKLLNIEDVYLEEKNIILGSLEYS